MVEGVGVARKVDLLVYPVAVYHADEVVLLSQGGDQLVLGLHHNHVGFDGLELQPSSLLGGGAHLLLVGNEGVAGVECGIHEVVGVGAQDQLHPWVFFQDPAERGEHLLSLFYVGGFGGEMGRYNQEVASSHKYCVLVEVDVLPLLLLEDLIVWARWEHRLSVQNHRFRAFSRGYIVALRDVLRPAQVAPHFSLLHANDIDTILLQEIDDPLHLLPVIEVGLVMPLLQELLEGLWTEVLELGHVHFILWAFLIDHAHHSLVGNPIELHALLDHVLVGLLFFHVVPILFKRFQPKLFKEWAIDEMAILNARVLIIDGCVSLALQLLVDFAHLP